MEKIPFKERVRNTAIECAPKYRDNLCSYEYLVISEAFTDKYCIIRAEADNYMHLIGVSSTLSPSEFFNKCIDGTLEEGDFGFVKKGQSEKSVKGSVREKIVVLSDFCNMFNGELKCQEDFVKGHVSCSFASATDAFTVGFVEVGRPRTLMKNNQLDDEIAKSVMAVLRKQKTEKEFSSIISGKIESYEELISKINQEL